MLLEPPKCKIKAILGRDGKPYQMTIIPEEVAEEERRIAEAVQRDRERHRKYIDCLTHEQRKERWKQKAERLLQAKKRA